MSIGAIRHLFFLSVLKLPVRSSEDMRKKSRECRSMQNKTNDIFLLKKDLKISNKVLFALLFIIVYLFVYFNLCPYTTWFLFLLLTIKSNGWK